MEWNECSEIGGLIDETVAPMSDGSYVKFYSVTNGKPDSGMTELR